MNINPEYRIGHEDKTLTDLQESVYDYMSDLIDAECLWNHLDILKFNSDHSELLEKCKDSPSATSLFMVNIFKETIQNRSPLNKYYPEYVFEQLGYHKEDHKGMSFIFPELHHFNPDGYIKELIEIAKEKEDKLNNINKGEK